MKGEISDIENMGSVAFIHIQRPGLKGVWDRLFGIKHTIPFQHRMFEHLVEAEGELIGRQIEFSNDLLYFTKVDHARTEISHRRRKRWKKETLDIEEGECNYSLDVPGMVREYDGTEWFNDKFLKEETTHTPTKHLKEGI